MTATHSPSPSSAPAPTGSTPDQDEIRAQAARDADRARLDHAPDLPLIVPAAALANAKVRQLVGQLTQALREAEPELDAGDELSPLDLIDLSLEAVAKAVKITANPPHFVTHLVTRDEPIAGFTERKTHKDYVTGQTYYPFLAVERIPAGREFALQHKTGLVFAGSGVRDLVGVPYGDRTLGPGALGEWRVFVQSGSPNRKLRRGTYVLINHARTVPIEPTWSPKVASPPA